MYFVKVLCGVKGSGPDPVLRKQMVLKKSLSLRYNLVSIIKTKLKVIKRHRHIFSMGIKTSQKIRFASKFNLSLYITLFSLSNSFGVILIKGA